MRGDSPPRRQAGQGIANSLTERPDRGGGNSEGQRLIAAHVAPSLAARTRGGGGLGTDFDCDGGLVTAATLTQGVDSKGKGGYAGRRREDDENLVALAVDLQNGGLSEDLSGTVQSEGSATGNRGYGVLAHSLRAEGFDASEDGTGRGIPLVPETSPAIKARDYKGPSSDGDGDGAILVPLAFDTTQITSRANRSHPRAGDTGHPLAEGMHAPAIAYQCQGTNVGEMGTFRSGNGNETGGVPFVTAFDWQSGGDSRGQDPKPTAQLQRSQVAAVHSPGMAVRRLTPAECEALQGFPQGYTAITHRGKPAADGPRYRALGNSMAVVVMAWIGRRIQLAEDHAPDL